MFLKGASSGNFQLEANVFGTEEFDSLTPWNNSAPLIQIKSSVLGVELLTRVVRTEIEAGERIRYREWVEHWSIIVGVCDFNHCCGCGSISFAF